MTDRNRTLAISVLAGESVLSMAETAEAEAILARLGENPAFAAERAAWELRLAPLAHIVPPVAPSPSLWPRISAETINEENPEPAVAIDHAPAGGGVVVGLEEAIAVRTRHLEARLVRWRWATAAAAALAAGLAVLAFLGPRWALSPAPQNQRYIAVVNTAGDLPPLIVSIDLGSGELTLEPVDLKPEAGKSLELWALPPGARPVSLGLVSKPDRRSIKPIAPAQWKDPGLLLAVSVEPEGGSPSGQPTGPVIYKGKLVGTGP